MAIDERDLRVIAEALRNAVPLNNLMSGSIVEFATANLRAVSPRSIDPVRLGTLVDVMLAERRGPVTLVVQSTLDQDALVQPFASYVEEPDSLSSQFNIGVARNVPARQQIAIGVDLSTGWLDFIGVIVTPVGAPTIGSVTVTARFQRWRTINIG